MKPRTLRGLSLRLYPHHAVSVAVDATHCGPHYSAHQVWEGTSCHPVTPLLPFPVGGERGTAWRERLMEGETLRKVRDERGLTRAPASESPAASG